MVKYKRWYIRVTEQEDKHMRLLSKTLDKSITTILMMGFQKIALDSKIGKKAKRDIKQKKRKQAREDVFAENRDRRRQIHLILNTLVRIKKNLASAYLVSGKIDQKLADNEIQMLKKELKKCDKKEKELIKPHVQRLEENCSKENVERFLSYLTKMTTGSRRLLN